MRLFEGEQETMKQQIEDANTERKKQNAPRSRSQMTHWNKTSPPMGMLTRMENPA